jgi:folate-binding Fe-S cluster repair protein YgfZ
VPGSDYGVINNNDSITGVTISDITSLSGADTGTQIDLSNGTTIKIIGVDSTSFSQSLVGGTHF